MTWASSVTCDECDETITLSEAKEKGWIEQHFHAFPLGEKQSGYRSDKHFCSQGCRRTFMENYANLDWAQWVEAEQLKRSKEYTEI